MKNSPNRTLHAVVALQALTLVAVVAGGSFSPAAGAGGLDNDRLRRVPVLPNAAAQRQEIIRLLAAQVEAETVAQAERTRRSEIVDKRLGELGDAVVRVEAKLPDPAEDRP